MHYKYYGKHLAVKIRPCLRICFFGIADPGVQRLVGRSAIFFTKSKQKLPLQIHSKCKFYKQKSQREDSDQRTSGPVNPHLISWPSKAQNIQNLENIW